MYLFICLFAISRATPVAYGGPQARGLVRAVVAVLHHSHSNEGSKPHLQPTPQLVATPDQILNPLMEARDRTRILMDASWVR